MFSPTTGDVILRGSIDGSFRVLDAIRKDRVAGPLQLKDAVAFVRRCGARHIFQQVVDERGRPMGDPWRLARTKAPR
jgi:hypothetical protein